MYIYRKDFLKWDKSWIKKNNKKRFTNYHFSLFSVQSRTKDINMCTYLCFDLKFIFFNGPLYSE